MTVAWWLRQAKLAVNPVGPVAGRVMLERDAALRLSRLRHAGADALRQRARPSRRRMQALVLLPGGRLVWRSVPAPPAPGPLAANVRPVAIATCDMDRPMALGATPFPVPLHFGHECVAEVISVGGEVRTVTPGERVVVPFQISCGNCAACRAGHTANCRAVPPISMYGFGLAGGHWGGAVAEELAVPFADAMLVPLPDAVDSAAAASVADNVCDGYRHVARHLPALLEQDSSARVLVLGGLTRRHLFTASVPLYTALAAQALGATDVVLADARSEVREQAAALGIAALSPERAWREGPAHLVVDISATASGLRRAIEMTEPDGICTSSGALHAAARVPVAQMFGRNTTVSIGRAHARAVIPKILELMASGQLHPERVTTVVASLNDAQRALTEHVRGGSTKTIIVDKR